MPLELKKELLNYALNLGANDKDIEKFIDSVIDSGRIANLPGTIEAFRQMIDEQEGVFKAQLTSATPLDPGQVQAISQAIGGGRTVDIEQKVDEDILGGLILRVGNNLVDLSLKTQLNQFAKNAIG